MLDVICAVGTFLGCLLGGILMGAAMFKKQWFSERDEAIYVGGAIGAICGSIAACVAVSTAIVVEKVLLTLGAAPLMVAIFLVGYLALWSICHVFAFLDAQLCALLRANFFDRLASLLAEALSASTYRNLLPKLRSARGDTSLHAEVMGLKLEVLALENEVAELKAENRSLKGQ